MKTFYFSLLALTCMSFISMAQPVLTDPNTNLVIGDTYTFNMDTIYAPPGNAGANQTWDFSTVTSTSTIVANAMSAAGSFVPAASVKFSYVGGSDSYYKTNSTELTTLGVAASGVDIPYSDPEKFLSFPFQLNDTYADTWDATFFSGADFYRWGTTTVTADGNGTLILPSGTYTNILRVKTLQVYTDSVIGLMVFGNYNNEMYSFYKPGNHQPLFRTFTLTYDVGGSPAIAKATFFLSTVLSSVKDLNENEIADLEIFPNPASTKLNIKFKDRQFENVSFSLVDLSGKCVAINTIQSNDTYSIESGKVAAGIYQLNILSDGKLIGSRKVQLLND